MILPLLFSAVNERARDTLCRSPLDSSGRLDARLRKLRRLKSVGSLRIDRRRSRIQAVTAIDPQASVLSFLRIESGSANGIDNKGNQQNRQRNQLTPTTLRQSLLSLPEIQSCQSSFQYECRSLLEAVNRISQFRLHCRITAIIEGRDSHSP